MKDDPAFLAIQKVMDELHFVKKLFFLQRAKVEALEALNLTTDTIGRNWFNRVCQGESPLDDKQWNACSVEILTGAVELLGKLQSFLNLLQRSGLGFASGRPLSGSFS